MTTIARTLLLIVALLSALSVHASAQVFSGYGTSMGGGGGCSVSLAFNAACNSEYLGLGLI